MVCEQSKIILHRLCCGSILSLVYIWFSFVWRVLLESYFLNKKSLNACIRILLVVKMITYGVML